jgi:MFS family permease
MPREDLKRNLPLLYAIRLCEYLVFFTPVIVIFFQNQGLSMTQVMVLQTAFAAAVVALEVPSGFFADRVGRRPSLFLGAGLITAACVVYGTGSAFAQFLAAELLWAFGASLLSGADSAVLYDTLFALGRADDYQKIEGHASFLGFMGAAAAAAVGGFVAAAGLRLTFFLTAVALAAATVAGLMLREPPRLRGGHPRGELYYLYKIGRFALYKNAEVRWLILLAALITGLGTVGFWLYQPYFELCGIPLFYFGLIFALFNVFAATSGKAAFAVERLLGKRLALISLPVLLGASLFAMAAFVTPAGFLFVLFAQFVRGFSHPVLCDYINRHTWSDKRATVMSIKNLVARLVFIASAPAIGAAVDASNVRLGLLLAGAATLVGGAALILALRRDRVI